MRLLDGVLQGLQDARPPAERRWAPCAGVRCTAHRRLCVHEKNMQNYTMYFEVCNLTKQTIPLSEDEKSGIDFGVIESTSDLQHDLHYR